MFKMHGVKELSCVVLECSGHVSTQLDVIDLPGVFLNIHQRLSRLGTIPVGLFMACDDALLQGSPDATSESLQGIFIQGSLLLI